MLLESKIFKEILEVDATENITVGEYAQRVKEILKPLKENQPQFKFGFTSWLNTYSVIFPSIVHYNKNIPQASAIKWATELTFHVEENKSDALEIISPVDLDLLIESCEIDKE